MLLIGWQLSDEAEFEGSFLDEAESDSAKLDEKELAGSTVSATVVGSGTYKELAEPVNKPENLERKEEYEFSSVDSDPRAGRERQQRE